MKKYSRLEKTQASRYSKSAILYIILAIALIVVSIKFGIVLLTNIGGLISDTKNSSNYDPSDTTPPIIPHINLLKDYVNTNKIDITGRAEPGSFVIISINGKSNEVVAGSDGSFTSQIDLDEGENSILVFSKDGSGNESGKTQTSIVIYDKVPPEFTITKPTDKTTFYGSKERLVTIEGQVETDTQITINDRFVIIDGSGKFTFTSSLSDGENKFKVVAKDKAGNTTEKELVFTFSS